MRLHISENVIRAEFADISQMRRRPTRVGSPAQPGGEMPAAHKGQRNHQPKPPTHNHQPTTTNPQPPTHNHLAHSLRCTPSGQHTLKMLWHSAVFTSGSRGVRCPTLRNLRVPSAVQHLRRQPPPANGTAPPHTAQLTCSGGKRCPMASCTRAPSCRTCGFRSSSPGGSP